jgi:hypothetical protein
MLKGKTGRTSRIGEFADVKGDRGFHVSASAAPSFITPDSPNRLKNPSGG